MNPDADTTRIVRAEQFERALERLLAAGYTRPEAEARLALEEPHLACAAEQLRQPPERWDEIRARFFPELD